MIEFVRRSSMAALLAFAAATPAQADATADLQTKLDGALRSAKSFVVTTSYPAQAYSSTMMFVAPNRTRVAIAIAASTTDVVTIGATMYSSKNGAPFERMAAPPGSDGAVKAMAAVKVTGLHPDVTSDGMTYGAFQTTLPLSKLVTLTCTYDKRSYRLAHCSNDEVTQTYNNYDDPQNAVEAPPNAIDVPTPEPTKGGR